MFLSKRQNGIWYVWYSDTDGRMLKVSSRSKVKSQAVEFLRNFKTHEREVTRAGKAVSVSTFLGRYMEYSRTQHATGTTRAVETAFHEFLTTIGDRPLSDIQPKHIVDFIVRKRRTVRASTVTRYHACLRSAFATAIRWGLMNQNPCTAVPAPRIKERLPVYFTPTDVRLLLSKVTDQNYHDLITTAFFTGMRQGELLSLEYTDVDFDRAILLIRNKAGFRTKSGRNRVIPINQQLREVLMRRKSTATCNLVFHHDGKRLCSFAVTRRFKRLILSLGLDERLCWHSLRHSFASTLASTGQVSLYEIQQLLGHASPSMTQRYSHLMPNTMHGVVDRITL